MRITTMALVVLTVLAVAGCGGDDDCYTEKRCETVNGELTCVWVKVCPGDPEYKRVRPESRVTTPETGARWSARIRVMPGTDDGGLSFAERLIGRAAARGMVGEGVTDLWFRGWSGASILDARSHAPGGAVEILSAASSRDGFPACAGASSAPRNPALDVPDALFEGAPLYFRCPGSTELGAETRRVSVQVDLTRPGGEATETRSLPEGETARVVLDEAGRWRVRVVLIAHGLCDEGDAQAILLHDGTVEVVARP